MVREMFHGTAVLRALIEKVHQDHIDRLDAPEAEKLVPRPRKPRRRANTAIISRAVKEAIAARQWSEDKDGISAQGH